MCIATLTVTSRDLAPSPVKRERARETGSNVKKYRLRRHPKLNWS